MKSSNTKVNVLLVDDHPENLITLTAVLDRPDYNLVKAESGNEALKALFQDEFAVILLDVQMPTMDGFATAELIKKRETLQQVPIIFITAISSEMPLVFKGYEMGAVDYIVKPFEPAILRSKVAFFVDLFRKNQQLRQQEVMLREAEVQQAELKERKRTELERENLLRELHQAVQARDEFLSIASHELRTPLTALLLQVQLMDRLLAKTKNLNQVEKFREKLDLVTKQTIRLGKLVDSLLDVSRISAGKLVVQPEMVDLAELTREVVERFSAEAKAHGSALTVKANKSVQGWWDRLRLEQVMTNLLSNAIKYGLHKPVEVKVETKDSLAILSVRDQGIGIAPEDLQRIFSRFERAAASNTSVGGLGLGLYIAKEIVGIHGGAIKVESVPNQGSLFTVELPQSRRQSLSF